jgi:LacI family transcriptional regulator
MAKIPMSPNPSLTLADLARRLKLDKSSVSLALRGSRKVSEQTRERVMDVARRLGYQPNLAARQLSSGNPQVVALVLGPSFAALASEVVVLTVQGLAARAAAAGLVFSVLSSDALAAEAKGGPASALHPDGLFVWGDVPAHVTGLIELLHRPLVVLDPSDVSYASYPGATVAIDNAGGAGALTRHLVAQGCRRLLFVQAIADHLSHQQRWTGCREAWLRDRPLEQLTFCMAGELTDDALRSFCHTADGAIQCSNDGCAFDVWGRLQRLGISVPRQVLLAGFDGDRSGQLIGLTTALFDAEALAGAASDRLMAMMKGEAAPAQSQPVPVAMRLGKTTQRSSEEHTS